MAVYSPKFNVSDFELRGEIDKFLTLDQFGAALDAKVRVPAQLDWLGQLLGWSGPNYWDSFSASVDQKRQLLSGSFGVYNGYIYPEIVEVRNWDNTVVVKNNPYIKEGQTFILGTTSYVLKGVTAKGDNLELDFGVLPETFYDNIASTNQLKVTAPGAIPPPFRRPYAGITADREFTCEIKEGKIILFPFFNKDKTLPYLFNTFYTGSRYYFDIPVKLIISSELALMPTYDFDRSLWYINIPCDSEQINAGLSARLDYNDSFLIISIKPWQDPSDWLTAETVQYFIGAWGNKGGYLPFHFVFDSLSLYGFDERKSLYLEPVEREIKFDDLLNFVYQQKVSVNEVPPPAEKPYQVWWNPENKTFSIYLNDPLNCGPWIQASYPQGLDNEIVPDLTFANVAAFAAYTGELWEGITVFISNGSGLGPSYNVLGLTQTLTSPVGITMFKPRGGVGWIAWEFLFSDEAEFDAEADKVPANVKATIEDSDGLSEAGTNYTVSNLKFEIDGAYKTRLMKFDKDGKWYLEPPSNLKYIGDTRLYESSIDYDSPVEGEMFWNFSENNPNTRTASVFYYTGWEFDILSSEWKLVGDWVNVNTGEKGNLSSLTNLVGGSSYTNGVYSGIPLLGGSGTGATATITVTSNTVSNVFIESEGENYEVGDSLYADDGDIGGGSGFTIDVQEVSPGEPPQVVDYDQVLIYCDGNLLSEGETYVSEDFRIGYSVQPSSGTFLFSYTPLTFEKSTIFPKISISDSITSSFTQDISNLVFSGLNYYASPNVCDSETLLRLWKSTPLFCIDSPNDFNSLSYPNGLVADDNKGPSDPHWERYFIRLPPNYQRDGSSWQKINRICQNFGYWGSPLLPEDMFCPAKREKPDIYEELVAYERQDRPSNYVYTEPYFYSAYVPEFGYPEDYNNAMIVPVSNEVKDGFEEGKLIAYDPLHERTADTESLVGKGYGEWNGEYFRVSDCSDLNGHLVNDTLSDNVENIPSPIWDASIYKLPSTCVINEESGKVDANHFKIGYAFFLADLSAAEEAVFDFNNFT